MLKFKDKNGHVYHIISLFIILAAALLFSFVVWLMADRTTPELLQKEILVDPISILSSSQVTTEGYEIDGNRYYQEDEDPNIVFYGITTQFQSVEIVFGDNLDSNTLMQVFYPDENGNFSDDASFIVYGNNGKSDYIFNLPEPKTGLLRIDINGDFELADVRVSELTSTMVDQPKPSFSRKLLVFLFVCNFIFFSLIKKYGKFCLHGIKTFQNELIKANKNTSQNNLSKRVWENIRYPLISIAIFYIVGMIISKASGIPLYLQERVVLIVGGLSFGIIIHFRKEISALPEIGFIFIALISGFFFLFLTCTSTGITWDDGIHYQKALAMSYGGASYETEADLSLINELYKPTYNSETQDRLHGALLNQLYEEGAVQVTEYGNVYTYSNLGYVHIALGLLAGRVLYLPFSAVFYLGRICNLALYIILCTLAIHTLKYGKELALLIALLPVNLFQACNYTYDTWIFAWLFYAVCRYISFIQDQSKKFSIREILIIALCIVLGCGPKPVYLPLLLILLVIPKEKFRSAGQRKIYYAIAVGVICAGLIIGWNYLLKLIPTLTDKRGGREVDAPEQFKFIMNNPGKYTEILFKYVFQDYISLRNDINILTRTGYFPRTDEIEDFIAQFPAADIWLIMLIVTSFISVPVEERQNVTLRSFWGVKIVLFISGLISTFLIVTAIYISFNSVGSESINGCQGRYLTPLLISAFWLLRSRNNNISNKNNNIFVIYIIAFILLLFGFGYTAFWVKYP